MKIKDIRSMGAKELEDKLKEARIELMKLNAQVATGTAPKSPGQIKATRKTIARIKTVLKQKAKTEDKKE
jgi:large subunit ribosomal protein L29